MKGQLDSLRVLEDMGNFRFHSQMPILKFHDIPEKVLVEIGKPQNLDWVLGLMLWRLYDTRNCITDLASPFLSHSRKNQHACVSIRGSSELHPRPRL